ncbi:hypothetical protein [Actinospongicola halichondriae]|uniref:hypothetical protein n=1 Tax=Actinospongicola halichondriae TaxID=3236844 RepID=UPI003D3BB3F1
MEDRRRTPAGDAFWEAVLPMLAEDDVEEGTMMQFPCLRSGGEFFAMPHHETGAAVLKLPADRVARLVADGTGAPFGPGKKVFKEWVLVPAAHERHWLSLAGEARAFVNPAVVPNG